MGFWESVWGSDLSFLGYMQVKYALWYWYEDLAIICPITSVGICLHVPYNPLPSSSSPWTNLNSQWRDRHPYLHLNRTPRNDPRPSLLTNPPLSPISPNPTGLSLLTLLYLSPYHFRPELLPYTTPGPSWLVNSTTTYYHTAHTAPNSTHLIHLSNCSHGGFFPKYM